MSEKKNKLWFSILSKDARYYSDEPNFIPSDYFEWTKNASQIADVLESELLEYLKNNQLESYFNTKMSENVKKWKTISLKWWGLELYSHQKLFPKTTAFINSIPNLVSASFNLLEANSSIYPHCGDTNGIYRCHLGLIIPTELPECGFRVENEKKSWKKGEWLIFIDAKEHEAWNMSKSNRFIFVIDIIRDEYSNRKNIINSIVLTGLFLQRRAELFSVLYSLKNIQWVKNMIVYILLPFCFISIKIRNTLSKIGLVS